MKPVVLFDRVAAILEQARGSVVRAVNTHMVWAYWLIGREIVQEVQGGKGRATYGEQLISELSTRLVERYGRGFSKRNPHLFKQFYLSFGERREIVRPVGALSHATSTVRPVGALSRERSTENPVGDDARQGFSPQLSWSHYRALMRVENVEARDFMSERLSRAHGTSVHWSSKFSRCTTNAC